MNRLVKVFILLLLVSLLFCVRAFEETLFYDPLIVYFQNAYLYAAMPSIDVSKLMFHLFFRYSINSIITIGIIYVIFEHKSYVKFTSIFLLLAFIILSVLFVILLKTEFFTGYLLPFYIRRFLIHPLFLLLLVPTFYFQNLKKH